MANILLHLKDYKKVFALYALLVKYELLKLYSRRMSLRMSRYLARLTAAMSVAQALTPVSLL